MLEGEYSSFARTYKELGIEVDAAIIGGRYLISNFDFLAFGAIILYKWTIYSLAQSSLTSTSPANIHSLFPSSLPLE